MASAGNPESCFMEVSYTITGYDRGIPQGKQSDVCTCRVIYYPTKKGAEKLNGALSKAILSEFGQGMPHPRIEIQYNPFQVRPECPLTGMILAQRDQSCYTQTEVVTIDMTKESVPEGSRAQPSRNGKAFQPPETRQNGRNVHATTFTPAESSPPPASSDASVRPRVNFDVPFSDDEGAVEALYAPQPAKSGQERREDAPRDRQRRPKQKGNQQHRDDGPRDRQRGPKQKGNQQRREDVEDRQRGSPKSRKGPPQRRDGGSEPSHNRGGRRDQRDHCPPDGQTYYASSHQPEYRRRTPPRRRDDYYDDEFDDDYYQPQRYDNRRPQFNGGARGSRGPQRRVPREHDEYGQQSHA